MATILTLKLKLTGESPISFSAPLKSVKNAGEKDDAFERRVWKERTHSDAEGRIFIPAQALKNCMESAGKYLQMTVPGKGKRQFTGFFAAGVMCLKNMYLPGVTVADIKGEWLFVPANGQKGGGKRVWKCFPFVESWSTETELVLLDPVLIDSLEQVKEHLDAAGKFVGMGRWRPQTSGLYGRFSVDMNIA